MAKRKGTANEQAWRRIPPDIWQARHKLVAMGVSTLNRKSQQWQQSLGTADRDEASLRKAGLEAEWRREEQLWRGLLRDGPASLSEMEALELARLGAARRWEQHKSSPLDAPFKSQAFPRPPFTPSEAAQSALRAMSLEDREAAKREGIANLKRLMDASPLERMHLLREVRDARGYPWCFPEFRQIGLTMAEERRGEATSADLEAAGIRAADEWSRLLVNLEGIGAEEQLRESLGRRALGDLSVPQWVTDAERIETQRKALTGAGGGAVLTFDGIIDEEERLARLRLEGHDKALSTLRKYRTVCKQFATWRASGNATTTTLAEAERWRDALVGMADKEEISRKDARIKAGIPRAVIGWAIAHNREARARDTCVGIIFPDGNPLVAMALPRVEQGDPSERTYPKHMARRLLEAARLEERPEFRWLPWLLVYTGMRHNEAAGLEKADIREYEGCWFCVVRWKMGATLEEDRVQKGKRTRRIPLHDALIAEGFVEWVKARPDGRLFTRKHGDQRLREWVHSVFPKGLGKVDPVHGLRHLFEALIMDWDSERSQDYVTGRSIKGSAKGYGQSDAIIPALGKLVNSIPPLLPLPTKSAN
ncbi:hypothetical protein NKJ55_28345 [Mesorhizobium sp. M0106]|uniref:hypothetical protein n=1 Tax=Mesorhizobium sp. M0106 TaxID=2956880 RepID=UPI00333D34BF